MVTERLFPMCGIVGYVGPRNATPIILNGLKRLQYRGYDSAGIAILENDQVKVLKEAGKIIKLEDIVYKEDLNSTIGIAHTRWATHGAPTTVNAHPHTDCRNQIAVVHNGIIENYQELRQDLLDQGHQFRSETDTEVIPHLIEEELRQTRRLDQAVGSDHRKGVPIRARCQ